MSGAETSELDPLEGIRDVFAAYKMLSPLGSKSYLDLVTNHLDKVFEGFSEPRESVEGKNEALDTIRIVFNAFKRLRKWDTEAASKILVEHLDQTLTTVTTQSLKLTQIQMVTPEDSGCQAAFIKHEPMATAVEPLPTLFEPFTVAEVTNTGNDVSASSKDDETCANISGQNKGTNIPANFKGVVQGRNLLKKRKLKINPRFFNGMFQTPGSAHLRLWQRTVKHAKKKSNSDLLQVEPSSVNSETSENLFETTPSSFVEEDSEGLGIAEFSQAPKQKTFKQLDINDGMNAQTSNDTTNKTFDEVLVSMKDSIHKAIEATLEKSDSPYSLSNKAKGPFFCHICSIHKGFSGLELLASHIWRHHTKEWPTLNCPDRQCEASYTDPASFRRHVKKHQGGLTQIRHYHRRRLSKLAREPSVSKFKRPNVYPLKGTERKKVPCPYCNKMQDLHYIEVHKRIHTGEKPYSCKHCLKKFTRKDYLEIHLNSRERPFPCQIEHCCKSFALKKARKVHELSHRGNDKVESKQHDKMEVENAGPPAVDQEVDDPADRPLRDFVGSSVPSSEQPKRPKKKNKVEPATCGICNYMFSDQRLLGSHMRREHADPVDRPHVCSFCGERFKETTHLINHERLKHTRKGLYNCADCLHRFLSPAQLEAHRRSKHSK